VYRSPTSRIGVWLEIRRLVTGEIETARLTPEGQTLVRWNPKTCARETAEIPSNYDVTRMAENFGDSDLRQLVKAYDRGIVYTWSPHMPLSIKALRLLRIAAAKFGMTVFPVLDPDADRNAAEYAVKRAGWDVSALRRIESIELFERGMAIHFPSALVFAGGKIRGEIIPGAKEELLYEQLIALELAK